MNNHQLNIGIVQERWHKDPHEHQDKLAAGIFEAAKLGADVVCLQELTLSPYFCTRADVDGAPYKEDIHTGPTAKFVSRCAKEANVFITASLFENAGYYTAVAYDNQGKLIATTRKQ